LVIDKMLVCVPTVGQFLVTEGRGRICFDLVADTEEVLPTLMENLENDLRSLTRRRELSVDWIKSASIPQPLR
jgi:hypothetical protein